MELTITYSLSFATAKAKLFGTVPNQIQTNKEKKKTLIVQSTQKKGRGRKRIQGFQFRSYMIRVAITRLMHQGWNHQTACPTNSLTAQPWKTGNIQMRLLHDFFISNLGFWSVLKLLIYIRKISSGVAQRLLKSKLNSKRKKNTYMGGNAKSKTQKIFICYNIYQTCEISLTQRKS